MKRIWSKVSRYGCDIESLDHHGDIAGWIALGTVVDVSEDMDPSLMIALHPLKRRLLSDNFVIREPYLHDGLVEFTKLCSSHLVFKDI